MEVLKKYLEEGASGGWKDNLLPCRMKLPSFIKKALHPVFHAKKSPYTFLRDVAAKDDKKEVVTSDHLRQSLQELQKSQEFFSKFNAELITARTAAQMCSDVQGHVFSVEHHFAQCLSEFQPIFSVVTQMKRKQTWKTISEKPDAVPRKMLLEFSKLVAHTDIGKHISGFMRKINIVNTSDFTVNPEYENNLVKCPSDEKKIFTEEPRLFSRNDGAAI